jgi:predicted  nucleic acid-binding Zn-ribbon protein
MTALVGGFRSMGINHKKKSYGILTKRPNALTTDFFKNILDIHFGTVIMTATKEKKMKKETLTEATDRVSMKQEDLDSKKAELEAIVSETQKDEEKLMKASDAAKKNIENRLVFAYERLRTNAKNGLAVVQVMRGSCGGCFNKIPPQRQLDIVTKKKIIVCEHCGRVLVPQEATEA